VFTGAMRAASDLGWDGPANLLDAALVAASGEAIGYGVMVVMGGRIFAGVDVTKAHTHLLDAFESPGLGPIGVIDDGRVIFRRAMPPAGPVLDPPAPGLPIDIVPAYAGADARLVEACRSTSRGLVVAAMGRGNVPPSMADGIARWIADGKPVVVASRAMRGRVGPTYGYAGGGRRLVEMGVMFAGSRRPQQARIELALAVGSGASPEEISQVFFF
jgi:L-asparaginase